MLDSSEEFKSGMLKLCELLQIPTKFNDTTAILRVNFILINFCLLIISFVSFCKGC